MLADFLRHGVGNTCKWVIIYFPHILRQDCNGFTGPSMAQGVRAVLVLGGSNKHVVEDLRQEVNSHLNWVNLKIPFSAVGVRGRR